MYTYMCVYIYKYICIYINIATPHTSSLNMHTYIYVYTYIYTYIYINIYISICVYICIYVCIYIYIYLYISTTTLHTSSLLVLPSVQDCKNSHWPICMFQVYIKTKIARQKIVGNKKVKQLQNSPMIGSHELSSSQKK